MGAVIGGSEKLQKNPTFDKTKENSLTDRITRILLRVVEAFFPLLGALGFSGIVQGLLGRVQQLELQPPQQPLLKQLELQPPQQPLLKQLELQPPPQSVEGMQQRLDKSFQTERTEKWNVESNEGLKIEIGKLTGEEPRLKRNLLGYKIQKNNKPLVRDLGRETFEQAVKDHPFLSQEQRDGFLNEATDSQVRDAIRVFDNTVNEKLVFQDTEEKYVEAFSRLNGIDTEKKEEFRKEVATKFITFEDPSKRHEAIIALLQVGPLQKQILEPLEKKMISNYKIKLAEWGGKTVEEAFGEKAADISNPVAVLQIMLRDHVEIDSHTNDELILALEIKSENSSTLIQLNKEIKIELLPHKDGVSSFRLKANNQIGDHKYEINKEISIQAGTNLGESASVTIIRTGKRIS